MLLAGHCPGLDFCSPTRRLVFWWKGRVGAGQTCDMRSSDPNSSSSTAIFLCRRRSLGRAVFPAACFSFPPLDRWFTTSRSFLSGVLFSAPLRHRVTGLWRRGRQFFGNFSDQCHRRGPGRRPLQRLLRHPQSRVSRMGAALHSAHVRRLAGQRGRLVSALLRQAFCWATSLASPTPNACSPCPSPCLGKPPARLLCHFSRGSSAKSACRSSPTP